MTERLDRVRRESGTEYVAMAQGTGRPYTEYTTALADAFGTRTLCRPPTIALSEGDRSSITAQRASIADIYGQQ
jgi:hypothetical protein